MQVFGDQALKLPCFGRNKGLGARCPDFKVSLGLMLVMGLLWVCFLAYNMGNKNYFTGQ